MKSGTIMFARRVITYAGLKKLLVCRHPTDPTLELPAQNILLDL